MNRNRGADYDQIVRSLRADRNSPRWMEELYENHHHKLCHYARRIVKTDDEAEDVVQTVYVKLLRWARGKCPRIPDSGTELLGYILRAVERKSLDTVGSSHNRLTDSLGLDIAQIGREMEQFAEKFETLFDEAKETLSLLSKETLDAYLDDPEREGRLERLSLRFEASVETIKKRLTRAKKEIKRYFAEHRFFMLMSDDLLERCGIDA